MRRGRLRQEVREFLIARRASKRGSSSGSSPNCKLLLTAKKYKTKNKTKNRTAIHLAAAEGNSSIVEALLRAGASPLVKDRWGATPLDEAKREGRKETVALLEAALKN